MQKRQASPWPGALVSQGSGVQMWVEAIPMHVPTLNARSRGAGYGATGSQLANATGGLLPLSAASSCSC
jgi:hypothetical protein